MCTRAHCALGLANVVKDLEPDSVDFDSVQRFFSENPSVAKTNKDASK